MLRGDPGTLDGRDDPGTLWGATSLPRQSVQSVVS